MSGFLIKAVTQVSIHASRCREAKPRSLREEHRARCFNPRLPLPGGEASAVFTCFADCLGFQSTPPVAGRRSHAELSRGYQRAGFNPRLPLPGGEARHPRRPPRRVLFQSTPPVAGRRSPAHFRPKAAESLFQSTPPVAGRRSPPRAQLVTDTGRFQSTPPVAGRRSNRLGYLRDM